MIKNRINFRELAKKIVGECLMVKPGEKFWIACADPYYLDFAEEAASAAIEIGAYPLVTVNSDVRSRLIFDNSLEYLKKSSGIAEKLNEIADVCLLIAFPKDPDNLKDVSPEKIAANASSQRSVWDVINKRNEFRANLRKSSMMYPTPESAKKAGLSFEDYEELIWSATDIDYKELSSRAKKMAAILSGSETVRITTEDGTDLEMSIKGRPVLIDDGIMDEDDIESNTYIQNIPTGEVYMPPVETSANGVAVFQYNVFIGTPLKNMRLTFKDGKVVDIQADEGAEKLREVLKASEGDKYNIAELGIGLNPHVKKVTGHLALDEKIYGTIHIAIGENRMFGGKNDASLHQDFVMCKPTVEVDGKMIMKNGEYMI